MKKAFLIMISLVVAVISFIGINHISVAAYSTQDDSQCGLCVTATGVIKVQPDLANISFNIETKNKKLDIAQSENSQNVQKLIKSLNEQGIDENDIKTTGFYVYPEYDYNYGQRLTGYKVSNQLNVKTRDISSIGKLIDVAASSGANIINGIQFSIENNVSAYNSALEKAIELARDKAVVLSRSAGIYNIKITSIKEISNNYYGGIERASYAKNFDSGVSYTPIMHGDIEISATVEIRYEISFPNDN